MKKVVIIGNGCSATEKELGSLIDQEYDLVIRMNRFKTTNYEKFVGTKTDLWAITDNFYEKYILKNELTIEGMANIESIPNALIWTPEFKGSYLNQDINPYKDKLVFLDGSHGLESYIKSKIDLGNHWPTLGMVMIYYCLLKEWEVHIHGFDNKSTKYEYLHYYDVGNPDWSTSKYYSVNRVDHKDQVEADHLNELLNNKIIKRL